MSLNGYSWVEGNVANLVDPSGLDCSSPLAAFISGCSGGGGATGILPQPRPRTNRPSTNNSGRSSSSGSLGRTGGVGRGLSRLLGSTVANEFLNLCIDFIENLLDISIPQLQNPAGFLDFALAEATPERIDQLSRACRAGNGQYNGACHELLLLCNAGVEEACRARSTCDDSILDALQQEKGRVCNVYGGRNCPAGNHMLFPLYNKEVLCRNAGERIRLNSECVNARMRIVNECYQGIPDEVHTGEIVRAMGVEEDCWNIFIRNNCADMYLPQQ